MTEAAPVVRRPGSRWKLALRIVVSAALLAFVVSKASNVDDAIHVSDLPESATYRVIDPPEGVLAMVQPPKEVEQPEAATPAAEVPAPEAAPQPE